MRKAWIHPRVLITTITTLCIMAWVADRALSSITPPDQGVAAAHRLRVFRSQAQCQKVGFERVADDSNLAAFDEEDEREEVRETVRTSLIPSIDLPVVIRSVQILLIPDCDPRGVSPGSRLGPPPRMPPA